MEERKTKQNLKRKFKKNLYYNTTITAMEETGQEIQFTDNLRYKELLMAKNIDRAEAIKQLNLNE